MFDQLTLELLEPFLFMAITLLADSAFDVGHLRLDKAPLAVLEFIDSHFELVYAVDLDW